nr:hypothetical protein [Tanacetum cinerariifolium]
EIYSVKVHLDPAVEEGESVESSST